MTSLGFESKNQTIYQMISDLDADGSGQIDFELQNSRIFGAKWTFGGLFMTLKSSFSTGKGLIFFFLARVNNFIIKVSVCLTIKDSKGFYFKGKKRQGIQYNFLGLSFQKNLGEKAEEKKTFSLKLFSL